VISRNQVFAVPKCLWIRSFLKCEKCSWKRNRGYWTESITKCRFFPLIYDRWGKWGGKYFRRGKNRSILTSVHVTWFSEMT